MGVDIVQTFLLSTDIRQSAKWLDSVRLNSQVNEALIILRTLTGWYEARGKKGWPHHTVTQMWKGYEPALLEYALIYLNECGLRCISVDTISERVEKAMDALSEKASLYFNWDYGDYDFPPWLTEGFASNHRAILLGKVKESYDELAFELTTATMTRISCQDSKASVKRYSQAVSRFSKAIEVMDWYQQWNWTEEPAKRNEAGKWPYLWPEKED